MGALPASRWTLGAFGPGLGGGSLRALEGFHPQHLTEGAALVGGGELVQQGRETALLEALVSAAKQGELSGSPTRLKILEDQLGMAMARASWPRDRLPYLGVLGILPGATSGGRI